MFLSNVLADESRLYSGIGLESYYIDQPMSAINYGPSIQIGFKIEFSGSTYLRFGYGVEFTPMGSDDGGHWVAINNQNIFLGLGLPIYKEENNCITFEAGGLYSAWNIAFNESTSYLIILGGVSGRSIMPFIRIGYQIKGNNDSFGIEFEYRLGNNKQCPSGMGIYFIKQVYIFK
ncbi:MAG: hypothetical protein A2452_11160 [Candidatus Firestonebacteria bacterium RIFOXYC2_FULL_39_67]|nr:MAG: hypothetical protein A2452_11160 [Candidatus Firestonebacteria bacterium RIFOXYC2_FULL_39_67]